MYFHTEKSKWSCYDIHDNHFVTCLFTINFTDQLLSRMTSYNDHWMTSVKTLMTSYWIAWRHIMMFEWLQWQHERTSDDMCGNHDWSLNGSHGIIKWHSACWTSNSWWNPYQGIQLVQHFMRCLWMSWRPLFFMVQCMTFMSSCSTVNDSVWIQCFSMEFNPGKDISRKSHSGRQIVTTTLGTAENGYNTPSSAERTKDPF